MDADCNASMDANFSLGLSAGPPREAEHPSGKERSRPGHGVVHQGLHGRGLQRQHGCQLLSRNAGPPRETEHPSGKERSCPGHGFAHG